MTVKLNEILRNFVEDTFTKRSIIIILIVFLHWLMGEVERVQGVGTEK